LNKQDITVMVKSQQQQLKDVEHRVELYNDFIRGQQLQKHQLEDEIKKINTKRNNFGDISSSLYKDSLLYTIKTILKLKNI